MVNKLLLATKRFKEESSVLKKQNLVGKMVKQEIKWHFSPPSAPHFGGVWEGLVKSATK
jgi:hypothetical protein